MLSLDDPRWGDVQHAYGGAADVPDLLRVLASSAGPKAGAAIAMRYGSVSSRACVIRTTFIRLPMRPLTISCRLRTMRKTRLTSDFSNDRLPLKSLVGLGVGLISPKPLPMSTTAQLRNGRECKPSLARGLGPIHAVVRSGGTSRCERTYRCRQSVPEPGRRLDHEDEQLRVRLSFCDGRGYDFDPR